MAGGVEEPEAYYKQEARRKQLKWEPGHHKFRSQGQAKVEQQKTGKL